MNEKKTKVTNAYFDFTIDDFLVFFLTGNR